MNSITFSPLAVIALATLLSAQAPPANKPGSLLEGLAPTAALTPDGATADYASPAEYRLNQDALGLRSGWESGRGDRTTFHYKWVEGYLLLTNGQRLDGEFAILGVQANSQARITIKEVKFREAKDRPERKIPGKDVEDFSVQFTIDDLTKSGKKIPKDPSRVFHPGVVRLADGRTLEGLAALVSADGPGGSGTQMYFAKSQNAQVKAFPALQVISFTQRRPDAEQTFLTYAGHLMPVLVDGKNLMLFQNPRPTTQKKGGFGVGLANMLNDLANQAQNARLAERAAQNASARRATNAPPADGAPGDPNAPIDLGSTQTAEQPAQAQPQGDDLPPPAVSTYVAFKEEFVIRNQKTGVEVIVSDENSAQHLLPLVKACPAIAELSAGKRREALKFKNLPSLVRSLDRCF